MLHDYWTAYGFCHDVLNGANCHERVNRDYALSRWTDQKPRVCVCVRVTQKAFCIRLQSFIFVQQVSCTTRKIMT